MKKKWLSSLLAAALTVSLIPPAAVSAAGAAGVPNDFLKPVTLPLMPAADGTLYDEPELELPDPADSGFISEVKGGEPHMPVTGLLAEVEEPAAGATEIATAEQLQAMTAGSYVLTADIDLSGTDWIPITLSTKNSNVTLDGQGHTLKGLSVTADSEDNYGLFGYVYGAVTVKNLRLDDVTLDLAVTEESSTSEYGVGALFGSVKGAVTLDNVAAEVSIARTGAYICKIGGLVGMSSSTVTASDVAVEVSMPEADDELAGIAHYPAIGGIAGMASGSCSFARCYADVELYTTNWSYNKAYGMGGMIGYINNGHKVTAFTDCMVEGTLVSEDHRTGGLVGATPGGLDLKNCVVAADVTGREVGGYCAYLQNYSASSSCVDCRYSGKLTVETIRDSYAGGFFGQGSADMITCTADVTIDVTGATSNTCYLGGFSGDGSGTVKSCALDVRVSDFYGTDLFLGGVFGDGKASITDTLVTLDAVELRNAAGSANIGALVGGSSYASLEAQNCGAEIFVSFSVPGEADSYCIGGLLGRGSGSMVKCWADGNIYLYHSGADGTAYYLGGLAGWGSGAMSQCYGGVEISCAYYPDSTTGYGYVGGLAGSGGSMFSCWSDVKISADGKTFSENVGGLCGYSNGSTYRDCTFAGTIEGVKAVELGGLLGSCQTGYFYNCYVEGDLEGGRRTGGLLGQASHATTFADCKFEGSVTALEEGGAGGLIAAADEVLNGTATLRRCEVNADITCPGGNAYGMAGPTKAYDCEFRGELSGADMGGIGESGSFYDCTATVWLDADQRSAERMNVGGISSASASVASNCRVTNHLRLTVDMDENENSLQIRFGGIGGIVVRAEDCETMGVTLSCYGDDSEVDEEKDDDHFNVSVGGIAGEMNRGMDDCRVSGSVSARVTLGSVYVGGLAGKDTSSVNGSSVSGCVTGGATGSLKKSTVYAGGLLGTGTDKTLISGCSTSGGFAYCSDDKGNAYNGKWTGNDKYDTGSKDLKIPERPDENYTILTFGYPDATETADSTVVPLGGVTITAGKTALGKTDSAGMLTIERDQVDSMNMKITGSKEGYFTADSGVTLAGGGSTSLYLMEKTAGKFYLTSALYTRDKKTMDLLTDPNSVVILQMDTEPQSFFFGVDWNDADKGSEVLQLTNEDGSRTIPLTANSAEPLNIYIQNHFKPEEDIYLEGKASFKGVEVTEKLKLKLKVKNEVPDITMPESKADFGGDEGLYFLDGLGVGMKLGNLAKLTDQMTFENGVFKFQFNIGKEKDKKTEFFTGKKVAFFLGGEVQVPYSEEGQGEWSGAVQFGINRSAQTVEDWKKENDAAGQEKTAAAEESTDEARKQEDEGEIIEWDHTILVGPGVPVKITSQFDAGFKGDVGLAGKYDAVGFYGKAEGDGKVTITATTGISWTEDWKAEGGGGGSAELKLPITYKKVHGSAEFDPELEGKLFLTVVLQGGELLDVSLEYDVGGFVWNKNGVTWRVLGEDIVTAPSTRAYLSAGGGFTGATMESMLSNLAVYNGWTDTAEETEDKRLVYENIQIASAMSLALEDGVPVLYFTADDGEDGAEGRMADHTALWRSEQQPGGAWGVPTVISDGGYPDEVHTDGTYAVWTEAEQTDSFENLLTTTDIKIARSGEVIHTIDGGGYVYAPEIAADADGNILVIWLADEGVTAENFVPRAQRLNYAKYDAASAEWTSGSAETTATPVSTTLVPGNTAVIYTSDADGTLYQLTGSKFGTCKEYLTGLGRYATNGSITASIDESGLLTVWEGTTETAVLELGTRSFGLPVICTQDEDTYVVWAQNDGVYYADSTDAWATIRKVCDEATLPARLSAAVVDGRPFVSYYRSEAGETAVASHLICAHAEDISGTDLVLSDLELDCRDLEKAGVVRLLGTVTNRMKSVQNGYAYLVTDESGAEATSGIVELEDAMTLNASDRFSILIGHDVTAQHSYTVEIAPLTGADADTADNTAAVTARADCDLASAFFRKTPDGVDLEALVQNTGAAPADNLRVEIYRADLSGAAVGSALLTREVDSLLPGSYHQVLLSGTQSDIYYKVVLSDADQELDCELLMWSDPETSGIWVQNVDVTRSGQAGVTVLARGLQENVQLHLALYQNGKMVANDMQSAAAWEGIREFGLDVGQLPEGEYTCAVYLLRQDSLVPLTGKLSDTKIISD